MARTSAPPTRTRCSSSSRTLFRTARSGARRRWVRKAHSAGPATVHLMIVGVPAETKEGEHRVALTPDGVRELAAHGHEVLVEAGAGDGSSLPDADYTAAGATGVTP